MAFTYLGTLATNLDKVRFYLDDVTENSGPQPEGGNFSDAELGGLITAEGSYQKAVAAGFETLAGMWSQIVDISVGPRRQAMGQTAQRYETLAKTWRRRSGSASGAGSRAVTRVDGYSDDVASDDV